MITPQPFPSTRATDIPTIKSPEPSTIPAPPSSEVLADELYHGVINKRSAAAPKAPSLCLCIEPVLRAGRCCSCKGLVLP